jgi:type II secretory pathway component PulM
MKRKTTVILTVMALMLAFTPTSPAFERHPEIRAALDALRNAKAHLEHAAHDFKGHRIDAIRAIDEAERQLRICMEVD